MAASAVSSSKWSSDQWPWWGKAGAALAGTALWFVFIKEGKSDGLQLGNLEAVSAEQIHFIIANSSARDGDVVLWVKQGEITFCERVVKIQPRTRLNITIACPKFESGNFRIFQAWAERYPKIHSVAKRIN